MHKNQVKTVSIHLRRSIIGHFERYIAHKVVGKHLIRAVYEYDGNLPVLITVYFPYVERYSQGGSTYEDKILE